ncbi:unnamed protein product [Prorocentrum cordatum]|uniref:cellulase n=1 Tax=Prorocentrum cordatum TaxID=2364126 RepID=A0ABN9U549_9DINO|nr:unnamed protein product [Polarella glacialis]
MSRERCGGGRPPARMPDGWVNGTFTTGYWDCCKPSCAWLGKGNVDQPPRSCAAVTQEYLVDTELESVCTLGGIAAGCVDNQPFAVSSSLSMGFAAAAVGGGHGLSGDENCGQCFELVFTDEKHPDMFGGWGGSHSSLVGKTMIVQIGAMRVMRFETNALRVRYGVPIFVTFSPDEGHNLLMVRLSRTRRQDPVHKAADDEAHSRLAGGRGWPRVAPDMDGLRMDLPMATGEAGVPPWNERRRILARDPMASVDGFRILVESGDLYGFLPIVEGMPVALTDHIDRSEDKNLLRGRVGRVQSWVCDGDGDNDRVTRGGETILKKTPKVIFVLFEEGDDGKGGRKPCQWTIEGMKTPGLHPYKNMYPTVGQWSRADGLRVCSVCLEDKKRPGTPWQCMECGLLKCQEAFHASQHHPSKLTTRRCVDCPERRSCRVCEGRKYEEAFAPYQWDLAGNSRCRGGMCKECEELKKHLTCSRCGMEKLVDDFARIERNAEERKCKACKKSMREEERQRAEEGKLRVCSKCGESKSKAEFSAHTWCIVSKETIACTQCVQDAAAQRDSAARKDVKACVVCEVAQRRDFFSHKMWYGVADRDRKCMRCVYAGAAQRNTDARKDVRACVVCEVAQRREYFSNWMWECAGDQHRKCKRCIDGAKLERGKWKCVECKGAFGREHYSNWLAGRSTQKANGKQRCNICCAGQERKRKEVAERTHASVTKKHKAG